MENLAWLDRGPQLYQNVYCLDRETIGPATYFSAYTPDVGEIPWTVALLLGSHSRKHRFENPSPPSLSRVEDALVQFERRLKLAWLHRREEPREFEKPLVKRDVAPVKKTVDGLVTAVCSAVKRLTLQHRKQCRSVMFPKPTFVKAARAWLKENRMTCQVSDKDGTFVLVDEVSFQLLQAFELCKPCYRHVSLSTIEVEFVHAGRQVGNLCRGLKELGYVKWANEVDAYVSKLKSAKALMCEWSCTIKTHKGDRAVVARSLHNSRGHLHCALSEVLNRLIGPELKKREHIAWNSEQVQRACAATKGISSRSVLLKYDVKEFFLSGQHMTLAKLVASAFNDKQLSSWILDCTLFVLSTQFVAWDYQDDVHFQVMEGSGMGERHSGAVSDLAFYMLCEAEILEKRDPLGILLYSRFKDDILVVVKDPQSCPGVTSALVDGASSVYRVERETFSLVAAPMLDLLVFKHTVDAVTQLAWKPYVKPTARHVPLSSSSCHSMSCHRSWPKAEIQRMFSRSCFDRDFQEAKEAKLERFRRFFLAEHVVRSAATWLPRYAPVSCSSCLVPNVHVRVIRLVLPYTARWGGFVQKLRRLQDAYGPALAETGLTCRFEVSFASSSKPLSQLVKTRVQPSLHVFRELWHHVYNGW
jgi:hypothetical protein